MYNDINDDYTPHDVEGYSSPAHEIGTTGLLQFGGFIIEEFLPQLRFPNGIKIYKEMADNDAVIHSILYAIEMLIRGVKWKVEPYSNDEQDRKLAEFVEECLADMEKSFTDVISEIVSFLAYGFCVSEIVYKRRFGPHQNDLRFKSRFNDGYWGWRKISIRSQETLLRWNYGPKNQLKGVWQYPPNYGTQRLIPRWKFLLFRVNGKKDNPESTSILRHAYRSWYFKKRIEEFEAVGIERDLAGLPIAKLPSSYMANGATPEQKAMYTSMKELVSMVRQNNKAGLIVPSDRDDKGNPIFDFALISSPGQKQMNVSESINRHNTNIAQSVLAEFIMLGMQGTTGSYALSESKIELFGVALETWINSIQEEFNRQAIPQLFQINNFDIERLPRLTHAAVEIKDITKISDYLQKLIGIGLIQPNSELEKWTLDNIKAPKPIDTMGDDF